MPGRGLPYSSPPLSTAAYVTLSAAMSASSMDTSRYAPLPVRLLRTIVSAIVRKSRTGKGAYLDVSMLEALIAADSVTYAAVLNGGEEYGNPRPGMIVAPIGDRYLAMQFAGSPQLWPRLLSVMDPELGRDPRFDTSEKRRANWRELRPIVESWLATFGSVEEARKVLAEARIPCAPVLKPAEVIAEPHMAE